VVRYAVLVIGLIAVLRHLGVETTSIIAVLGAASLAVGLALQGALSNVAAGVMLLLLRPYQVGDVVAIAGKQGTVRRLDLFNTEIRDGDNLKILVPNSKAFGDVITNYTELENRRIELVFGIGYDDDVDKAMTVAKACAAEDERIFKEPAPWTAMTELASSTVNITLRCWTGVNGYWDTRYALLKRVKDAFDREGISLPFPTTVSIPAPPSTDPGGPPPAQGQHG
jgi:small conductance mechanosensitive channel